MPAALPGERTGQPEVLDRLVPIAVDSDGTHKADLHGCQHPWIQSRQADISFALAIVANAIVLGAEVEFGLQNNGETHLALLCAQLALYVLFIAESSLRVWVDGWSFFSLGNVSGLFDLFIIVCSTLEYILWILGASVSGLVVLSAMRLVRLTRIACAMQAFPKMLRLLISSLACSLKALFWLSIVAFVPLYICSLICAMELGRQDCTDCSDIVEVTTSERCCSDHSLLLVSSFGSVDRSFFTHFMLLTLEEYLPVAQAAGRVSWIWYLYIVVFVLFFTFSLINLATSIIVDNVVVRSSGPQCKSQEAGLTGEEFCDVFLAACVSMEMKPDDEVTVTEFLKLMRSPVVREILDSMRVSVLVDASETCLIVDSESHGTVTAAELARKFLCLQGSKGKDQSLIVQGDLIHSHKDIMNYAESTRSRILQYSSDLSDALNSRLQDNIQCLPEATRWLDMVLAMSGEEEQEDCRSKEAGIASSEAAPIGEGDLPIDATTLTNILSEVEAQAALSGKVLAKLKQELQGSRDRVRDLEAKLNSRATSVQTDCHGIRVVDQWNYDRGGSIAQPLSILPERRHPALRARSMDEEMLQTINVGVELLLKEREKEARQAAVNQQKGIEVALLGATNLPKLDLSGKADFYLLYCICKIHGKTNSAFRSGMERNMSNPNWDKSYHFADYAAGDSLDFIVMAKRNQAKLDDILAVASLSSEQFLPHGFHGDVQLTEAVPVSLASVPSDAIAGAHPAGTQLSRLSSDNSDVPLLRVKVSIRGPALKKAAVVPPLQLSKLTNVTQERAFYQEATQSPVHLQHEHLLSFRRHACHAGKGPALHATRTPSSSDEEESARSRARRRDPDSTLRLSQKSPEGNVFKRTTSPASSSASPMTMAPSSPQLPPSSTR